MLTKTAAGKKHTVTISVAGLYLDASTSSVMLYTNLKLSLVGMHCNLVPEYKKFSIKGGRIAANLNVLSWLSFCTNIVRAFWMNRGS